MKKRVLAMALALVLCVGLAVPALAAETVITEAIPCQYDDAEDFSEGLAAVKLNEKWGFVDRTGQMAIPCQYDSAGQFSDGLAAVRLNGKWGFIDQTGRVVIPCQYDSAGQFDDGLALVRLNGKYGYIDQTGREIVPCQYDKVWDFSNGMARVGIEVGQVNYTAFFPSKTLYKCGFVNKQGQEVVPCKYDEIDNFENGFARVKQGEKYGFVDEEGQEVVPCKYDKVHRFFNGMAAVELDKKWGFVDQTGREVIPVQYEDVEDFQKDGAWVKSHGNWGAIDKTGKVIIPFTYIYLQTGTPDLNEWSRKFINGLSAVNKAQYDGDRVGRAGVVDVTGQVVIPFEYSRIFPPKEGYIVAEGFDGVEIFDTKGTLLCSGNYDLDLEGGLNEGVLRVMADRYKMSYGYFDVVTGKELIPCQYRGVYLFSEGMGLVWSADGRFGYVDRSGRVVVPCKYDGADVFRDGFAHVSIDKVGSDEEVHTHRGLIDKTGREVLPCQYDEVSISSEGNMVRVALNGKYGYYTILKEETAYPSTQTVDVDGEKVTFQCYALKEGNGMTNYIKLRDVADALNGSAAQFEVGFYGAVNIATGWAYTPNGSEGSTPFSGERECLPTVQKVNIDGKLTNLEAFTLTDDAGGGYTYYKLRDLGNALGFKVDWTPERGMFIETK